MWDYFHLPDQSLDIQTFHSTSTTAASRWQIWNKPKNVKNIFILMISAGGGGGFGFSGAAGTARGGGGGGGSGSVTKLKFPAILLPDQLYIDVGRGGSPGGIGGAQTYISITDSTNTVNLIASAPGGGTGGNGTASAPGGGGSGASTPLITNGVFGSLGIFLTSVTSGGTPGGNISGAVGIARTPLNGLILCGGAGGGSTPAANTNFAGGEISADGIIKAIPGGAGGGGRGSDGIFIHKPLCACGGSGGGTNGASGTGGAGGNGAIGCGGGGGGGGVAGGSGGSGGNGLIVIVSM